MNINIIFFAAIREQLDCGELTLNLPDKAHKVSDIKMSLMAKGEQWKTVFSSSTLLTALNQQMVNDDATIDNNDTVAFFPPVTGG
ncbi:molybdopterin converting factor subunit 1 [Thalassotalea nanhaiensis]|uniref:Molybdopterin converting factor subunit 1 n=1 Tax=Thalassotalea nanhaiensis TaxID=3065648 RepID=A0ABY9TG88_9GAMM|nr:molybdopterin converting factor subunit 1 [Colwelliaceae bacterium SQ345]